MKTMIIASRIEDNKVLSLLDESRNVYSIEDVLFEINVNRRSFYILIEGVEIEFKIEGNKFVSPSIEQLKKLQEF